MGQIRRVTRKAWLCLCVDFNVWNSFTARHIRMCVCVVVVVVSGVAVAAAACA